MRERSTVDLLHLEGIILAKEIPLKPVGLPVSVIPYLMIRCIWLFFQ